MSWIAQPRHRTPTPVRASALRGCVTLLVLLAAVSHAWPAPAGRVVPRQLDASCVGVYGTLFDFCDFSVYKVQGPFEPDRLKSWARRLDEAHARGRRNLVGLYTFDRVNYKKPIEDAKRDTDAVLAALDLKKVYAFFLSEENVTWNGGLDYLNALYDHIKARCDVPVYQWYSLPMHPHPKQRADGWIIDPYGTEGDVFRRYLLRYVILGKPVIDCINASEYPRFGQDSFDQVEICREFNVPSFFYCVDRKLGSPDIWLHSDDPELKRRREWVQQVTAAAHQLDTSKLPALTAEFSTGKPLELAGDAEYREEVVEEFGTASFLDYATIRGLLSLQWDGAAETLSLVPRPDREVEVQIVYHLRSEFDLRAVRAEVAGTHSLGKTPLVVALSENGWRFDREAQATGDDRQGRAFSVAAESGETFQGKELWLRLSARMPKASRGRITLDRLAITATMVPPERREAALSADAEGCVRYRDDFESRKVLHLAEIDGAGRLEWSRGSIGTRGVKDHASVVEIRQKFISAEPLKTLRARIQCYAHRSLGGRNSITLSLDGKTPLASETTSGKEEKSGRFQGVLEVAAPAEALAQGVREFWVHLRMANTAGVVTNPSNRIDWLEVEGEIARAQ